MGLDPNSFLDLAFLLVATILTLLSVNSLQLLARIRMEKSLFIPVIVSAVFFWCGSLVNVVFDVSLQNMPGLSVFQESVSLSYRTMLLVGLSILTYGVFAYWRLTRNVRLAKHERSEKHENKQEITVENPVVTEQVEQQANT